MARPLRANAERTAGFRACMEGMDRGIPKGYGEKENMKYSIVQQERPFPYKKPAYYLS
jgi:hypothetical protein